MVLTESWRFFFFRFHEDKRWILALLWWKGQQLKISTEWTQIPWTWGLPTCTNRSPVMAHCEDLGLHLKLAFPLEICTGVCTKCCPLWLKKRMAHHRHTNNLTRAWQEENFVFTFQLVFFLIRTIFEITILLSELLSQYFFPQKNLSFP